MKLNENTSVAMPIKNMIGIIFAVAMGVWAWADITSRLTSLETAKQLMEQDLLEASTQKPIDQEQFMLLEHMAIQLEKITTRVDDMMHNKVMIESINKVLDKATKDIEKLKDKQREFANGSSH
jgi:L-cysteine desulfidase